MRVYELGLYEKAMPGSLGWKEKLICAKECGFDFVEISIDESDDRLARLDWTDGEIRALQKDMYDTGMPIRSMCLSGHRKYPLGSEDSSVRERSLSLMARAIELADRLGIRIIQLAGYDVYYDRSTVRTKANFLENLKKAAEMAACRGIVLGFETMETEFMDTVWKSMFYVREVESPYLGVYPDSGNLTNAAVTYKTDVLEDLRSGRGHLVALHLKETVPGKYREIPFMTGHVDFEALIGNAWDLGVRRFVTEMWDVGKDSWREDILYAGECMRKILDKQKIRKG